jgi:hypothetical protein
MSQRNRKHPDQGGICSDCRHDLIVLRDGRVYCSNTRCRYHAQPHPMTSKPATGGLA